MEKTIPAELAAALVNDAILRNQFTAMYLLQQEVLAAITVQLHLGGVVDAQKILDHVRRAGNEPELGEAASFLAQAFCQRVMGYFAEAQQSPESGERPQ